MKRMLTVLATLLLFIPAVFATPIMSGGVLEDSITKDKLADQDWGDVSISSNSVTLDTDVVDSAEIADDAVTSAKIAEGVIQTASVSLSNADIKALRATPKELVAAPGAGKVIQFIDALLILDYGSNVLTESADNMVIEYDDGGDIACSQTIEAGSFIDASADTITNALPTADAVDASADIVDTNIALVNTGDGEYAGNAGADTTMTVKVTYRILSTGL